YFIDQCLCVTKAAGTIDLFPIMTLHALQKNRDIGHWKTDRCREYELTERSVALLAVSSIVPFFFQELSGVDRVEAVLPQMASGLLTDIRLPTDPFVQ